MMRQTHFFLLSTLFWSMPTDAQNECPFEICGCEAGLIRCDDLGLTSIPKKTNANVTWIFNFDLSGNLITKINADDLTSGIAGIDLSNNPITSIDPAAFDLSAGLISYVYFSGARFTEVPQALLHLTALKSLKIGYTPIQKWEPELMLHIGSNLESLVLDNVGIVSWPTWLQSYTKLTTLQLSSASFVVPPDAFDTQANRLTSLNMYNASLHEIPSAVSKLTSLTQLTLDGNNISTITSLPQSSQLNTISMMSNKLVNATQASQGLLPVSNSLVSLQLSYNKLTGLPDLSFLNKLQLVYLTANNIYSTGPASMPASLNILSLENNRLPSLHSFMPSNSSLSMVRFTANFIQDLRGVDIPATVDDMDVSSNLLTQLTDTSFPANSSLSVLTLDSNPLVSISLLAFSNLKRLTYLSMMTNRLTRIPLALGSLTRLTGLDLRDSSRLVCTCQEKSLRPWAMSPGLNIFGDCGIISIDMFLKVYSRDCPE